MYSFDTRGILNSLSILTTLCAEGSYLFHKSPGCLTYLKIDIFCYLIWCFLTFRILILNDVKRIVRSEKQLNTIKLPGLINEITG